MTEPCPYAVNKMAGDETFTLCELEGVLCILEGGYTCEIYENELEEMRRIDAEEAN